MDELKACMRCGSPMEFSDMQQSGMKLRCTNFRCSLTTLIRFTTVKAANEWNARADDLRLKEAVELMIDIRDIPSTSEHDEGYSNGIGMCLCELFDRIPELKEDKDA